MDAVTPKAKHDTAETHSHIVRPADMQWKKTRFPGCEVKGLLLDKATGLVTALMRFAPGATLPDHEHVKIEQTYVLEGKLVDKEGPAQGLTVGPGEFVWREAGSRHVAWTPEGGLMLAMFQVPNKFFERDGRVTDISGGGLGRTVGACFQGVSMIPKRPVPDRSGRMPVFDDHALNRVILGRGPETMLRRLHPSGCAHRLADGDRIRPVADNAQCISRIGKSPHAGADRKGQADSITPTDRRPRKFPIRTPPTIRGPMYAPRRRPRRRISRRSQNKKQQ